MSRFLIIRISKEDVTLNDILDRANSSLLSAELDKGFEIESNTRDKLVIRWFEKLVIERSVETGAFAGITFSEVKIISFCFVVSAKGKRVILIDPPPGKDKVHKALRLLYKKANFVFLGIDLKETLSGIATNSVGRIVAIETDPIDTAEGITMALKLSGDGQLMEHLAKIQPNRDFEFRGACIEVPVGHGSVVEAILSKSGLVKSQTQLGIDEIEKLMPFLKFK